MTDEDDLLAIPEYRPGDAAVLSDAERWPTLSPVGRERLRQLREHPEAPAWTHATGDRLTAAQRERVRHPLPEKGWLAEHLRTAARLPAYRALSPRPRTLEEFPVIGREDLLADVSAFVPLDADLDRMVHGTSSGSTGHALQIPDDIEDVARTFHLLRRLLGAAGVGWEPDPARMALLHTVRQRQAFTYAGIVSSFGEATMARVNLDPSAWEGGNEQRDGFVVDVDPQVISGNPTSLASLLEPGMTVRPLGLVSSAMALSTGLRAALTERFGVPVLDLYGLHETRPIAVSDDGGPFRVLPRVLVEVMAPSGLPVPAGQPGELVVTVAHNPLLPLVRYRTGDHGRLVEVDGRPAIADLEGRENTVFRRADGEPFPCVDLTQQLQRHGAHGWSVEQHPGGEVRARVVRGDVEAIESAVSALFGRPVVVERLGELGELGPGKPRRYRAG